jgi:GH15 family glucan-1,4-alpha-glucosidase
VRRRYGGDTLVLETEIETDAGTIRIVDFMTPGGETREVVRIVEGVRGSVRVESELRPRFDYGRVMPWLRARDGGVVAIAGPDSLWLRTPVASRIEDGAIRCELVVGPGQRIPFVLGWRESHDPPPPAIDAFGALEETESFWRKWVSACTYEGEWRDAVVRSAITLKALTYAPTGGIVAAPTTSLPEEMGGVRNWDYRFCWLRDAAFTLVALTSSGFRDEARAWRDWLLRAIAGDPADLQILYGLAGERRLDERELGWLSGHEGSRPVRIGNAATEQFQLDVYGEVLLALHLAREAGLGVDSDGWALERALLDFLEEHWRRPDEGIWESRGGRRHHVHSKVMAWVGFDRAVKAVEEFGLSGPAGRWRAVREQIHREVCAQGYDPDRRTFTQSYGARPLDAATLMIPFLGFLPPEDERVRGTVAAIERELDAGGLLLRYPPPAHGAGVDGLPGEEGAFLAVNFWLVGNYALGRRPAEARRLFERLLELRNDVGLLAEEYDPRLGRQLGNFPQAFSHVPLIMAALNLDPHAEPAPALD